jgi:subfamily B ATP-binding cassette protein MsbA
MFNDTLKKNVTIANRGASQAEVERVCEIAQVTEFFDELPAGYDTMLGEDGVRLSGGQKQRVALTRALLKDAKLLMLDEATSDLDANIKETVHRAIEAMDRDYAMLVIAHRLSTVINADCIYAVEDGEIAESGTHDDLISLGGTYSGLYETQVQSM